MMAATLVTGTVAAAQPIQVFSEYRRMDPFGKLIEALDIEPREILSPGVPRNAWSTYRIAVTRAAGTEYQLYVSQNPENAVAITLYRENYSNRAGHWTPVSVERVELPYRGRIPDPSSSVPGQTTQTFLMDIFVAAGAPVRRIKIEPQLSVGDEWIIYPMEVRVVSAEVPPDPALRRPPSSFLEYFCGGKRPPPPPDAAQAPEWFSARNGAQDVAMARALEGQRGRMILSAQIVDRLGGKEPKKWCDAAPPADPEWPLKVRDFLLRGRGFN
jgi:hypothetical protein